MPSLSTCAVAQAYQIRFQSLFHTGRAVSFPCDGQGRVLLEALSERARQNYERACAGIGSEYTMPTVVPGDLH
ncbi:hypothetical protein C7444_10333 [Sphaerotilus hippei]|uniref:Uncharacterized protein n=1 Tax=Sphaerotilus hippei TaxID=744406 RepID=A0A318H7X3_9BURK|nr:hypothetical protein [Sphaerotilus hippei]PXW97942.1 hypothetical protein C7444_10333 [Sphaerotilus hippei]